MQAWKQCMVEFWTTSSGEVYRWIRGAGDAALQMMRTPSEEFTVNIVEMDKAIRAAWVPVNRHYETTPELSVDRFMKEYGHHVRRRAIKARVFTGDMLLQRARKMGMKTANGLDLSSNSLLKRLPTRFRDALAQLLRMVERTGQWLDRVAEGFTSLVPKGKGGATPWGCGR